MNVFRKIKNCRTGIIMLAVAVILVFAPDDAFLLMPVIIGLALLIYGLRFLWFYIRMARHTVGGKSILYQGVIVMDIALFTVSISTMNSRLIVLIYLLGIYAFTGAIDVLRAFEAKSAGSAGWKLKLARGIVGLAFVIALFIIGFILKRTDIFVYGYCFSLVYSAALRIIGAFKRTAIVCIQ